MCGICGIVDFNHTEVSEKRVKTMADTLKHRGPDDEGYFFDDHVGLGFRRLAILDLSPAGHQPMENGDGSLRLIFNGEIYNYIEIREDLKKKGYKFRSGSDSEVILASYEEWGEECVKRFNGMWAFVIWNLKDKTFFASRDRMGVKPFYYYLDEDEFIFASEIKAILKNPEVKRVPNDSLIYDYLFNGTIDHTDETFFKGIRQLPSGHSLSLNPRTKEFKVSQYWEINPSNRLSGLSNEEYARRFHDLFVDSVKLRLRSDVAVGTCLSGGLDSSSIVCVISDLLKKEKIEQVGEHQKTFTAAFKEAKYDESGFAKEVIKKAGAKDFYTYPSAEKFLSEIEKVVYHQDEPFGSTSIYAQWNVFRLAHENGIKVMLDGQGSDEMLAGYIPSFPSYYARLFTSVRWIKLLNELSTFRRNYQGRDDLNKVGITPKLFASHVLPRPVVQTLKPYIKKEGRGVLEDRFFNEYKVRNTEVNFDPRNPFRNMLYQSFRKTSLPALLHYEDRDSMAFSIEARVPFLDYRLVEYVFSLPDDQKVNEARTKAVLRRAMHGIIPEKIENRLDKIGFSTPEDIWFRTTLHKFVTDIIKSKSFRNRGYVDQDKALEMLEDLSSSATKSSTIWRWVNLELWFRTFID